MSCISASGELGPSEVSFIVSPPTREEKWVARRIPQANHSVAVPSLRKREVSVVTANPMEVATRALGGRGRDALHVFTDYELRAHTTFPVVNVRVVVCVEETGQRQLQA